MTSRIVVTGSFPVRVVQRVLIVAVGVVGQVGGALVETGERVVEVAKRRVQPQPRRPGEEVDGEDMGMTLGASLTLLGIVWAMRLKVAIEDMVAKCRGTP